jgi:hypothetical protein
VSTSTIVGLVLGVLLVGIYIITCLYSDKTPNFILAAGVLLATETLVGGFRIVAILFEPAVADVLAAHEISPWYLLLAGLALIWLSILAIIQAFRHRP